MILRLFLICSLLIPLSSFAHQIAIVATSPFPSSVPVSSVASATYTVVNISSKIKLTIKDCSRFPKGSGLSLVYTTCGNPMGPGESCDIRLKLQAPKIPQRISAKLKVWAKPTLDFLAYPLMITVIPIPKYTITPSASDGGTISPNTPQIVESGDKLTFTAIPSPTYKIKQWRVDGVVVQDGGASYTLENITSNHTVNVTFVHSSQVAIGFSSGRSSDPYLPLGYTSNDDGNHWLISEFTLPVGHFTGRLLGLTCRGKDCIAVGESRIRVQNNTRILPLGYTSGDGGDHWTLSSALPLPNDKLNGQANDVTCNKNLCIAVGVSLGAITNDLPTCFISRDEGKNWTETFTLTPNQLQGTLNKINCFNNICNAVGVSYGKFADNNLPLTYISNNYGERRSWLLTNENLPMPIGQPNGELKDVFCVESHCTAVGSSYHQNPNITNKLPLAYTSDDGGKTWSLSSKFELPTDSEEGELLGVTCVGPRCITVGSSTNFMPQTFPVIYISNNYGKTWIHSAPLPLAINDSVAGKLYGVACEGSMCTAVGITWDNKPLVYTSNDTGFRWILSPQLPLPNNRLGGTLLRVSQSEK